MIAYLPRLYPDELIYSWFCRYYIHSGCITNAMALKELFHKRSDNPSIEFIGSLSDEAKKVIHSNYDMEKLVLEHTMFPEYARFIPPEDKKKALHRLAYDHCDAHHLFPVLPRDKADEFLKYCPECVKEDRLLYGETYWHRRHQLRGITVCVKHKCRLLNSSVPAKSESHFTLSSAELYTAEAEPQPVENINLISYASFVDSVFTSPIDMNNDIPVSAVLYDKMRGTEYMKKSGRSRYTSKLSEDITAFYKSIGIEKPVSYYQLQRILLGERCEFTSVCQTACFLNIPVKQLISPSVERKAIEDEYASHYVKLRPDVNTAKYDEDTAPVIERIAYDMYHGLSNGTGRPERVTVKAISRALNISPHRIDVLPKCKAIYEKYAEPYEEFWARRIIWAYDKLKKERGKDKIFWSDMRAISGVRMHHINEITPLLFKYVIRKKANKIIRTINFRKTTPPV